MLTDTLPDYYGILQVHPEADPQVIKKAYHTLMLDLGAHPDRGGDPERAKRINQAWEVLQDPQRRHAYDEERRRSEAAERRKAEPPPPPRQSRPFGLDESQWQLLRERGELTIKGYQAPGDRRCTCRRCGREWLTRSYTGMPARCPSCRSPEWSWRRYAYCFVCQHAFEVTRLDGPVADACKECPACKTDDWSLRPVIMPCLACGQPNRIRRSAWSRARCGACGVAFFAPEGRERAVKRWAKASWQRLQGWLDHLLLKPLGTL